MPKIEKIIDNWQYYKNLLFFNIQQVNALIKYIT